MKKLLSRLNELQRMLILSGLVAFVLLLLALIPLFLGQPGWMIGVAIGSVIEILNIFLLYKGNEFVVKKSKPFIFLIFYFLRMFLFLVGFLLTAFLGIGFGIGGNIYIHPIPAFVNSIWGVLIAYTPLQIVVIISMLISNKSEISIKKSKGPNNG